MVNMDRLANSMIYEEWLDALEKGKPRKNTWYNTNTKVQTGLK